MQARDPTEEGGWSQTDPQADNRNPACCYAAESLRSKGKHHRYIAACYTFRIMTIQKGGRCFSVGVPLIFLSIVDGNEYSSSPQNTARFTVLGAEEMGVRSRLS